jgi:hypothetical protein
VVCDALAITKLCNIPERFVPPYLPTEFWVLCINPSIYDRDLNGQGGTFTFTLVQKLVTDDFDVSQPLFRLLGILLVAVQGVEKPSLWHVDTLLGIA